MGQNRHERGRRDDYQLIGKAVDMFGIELNPDAAIELRDFIAQDFLPRMMRIEPKRTIITKYTEQQDTTLFSKRFGRSAYSRPDGNQVSYTGVSLSHTGPEAWKLRALLTRYNQDGTPNKIAVRHHIDMEGGRLFQARREVRVIRSNSDEVLAQEAFENNFDHANITERVAFEKPLTDDNVVALQQHLNSVAKRCIVAA